MNNPLTPVEVLQIELDLVGNLPDTLTKLGWSLEPPNGTNLLAIFGKYRAALELAKADAEFQEILWGTGHHTSDQFNAVEKNRNEARAKLYEELQK